MRLPVPITHHRIKVSVLVSRQSYSGHVTLHDREADTVVSSRAEG